MGVDPKGDVCGWGVWMGHVDGLSYAVPVKIMVKTDYGALMMHLVNVD